MADPLLTQFAINGISGLVMLVFGLVLVRGRRERGLALYLVGFGSYFVVMQFSNLVEQASGFDLAALPMVGRAILGLAGCALAVYGMYTWLAPWRVQELAIGLSAGLAGLIGVLFRGGLPMRSFVDQMGAWPWLIGFWATIGITSAAVAALARRPSADASLLALALGGYPAYLLATLALAGAESRFELLAPWTLAAVLLLMPALVWIAHKSYIGLTLLAFSAVAMVLEPWFGEYALSGLGVMRILGVFIIAYVVIHFEVISLDLRLRFAVRGLAHAVIFSAAVLFASGVLSNLFGMAAGWLGLLIGAMTVIVMIPFVGRFADQALTRSGAPSERYRDLVSQAHADGRMSTDEEILLATMARRLGLSPQETEGIHQSVRDQAL